MGSGRRAARWPWSKHLSISNHYCTRFDQLALRATSSSYSRIPLGSELTNSHTNRTVRVTVCNDIRDCDSTATQLRLNCDSTATQPRSKICLRESGSTWLSMSPKKKWRLQGVKSKRQILGLAIIICLCYQNPINKFHSISQSNVQLYCP